MITETTGLITLIPGNIPEELTERPQWVCWRLVERGERLTKAPFNAQTGDPASCVDLLSWSDFSTACASYEAGGYDGVGFVLSSGDPFTALDLDDCRSAAGVIKPWAQEILDRVPEDAYREVSVSGSGVHVILRAKVRAGGVRRGRVEVYSRERYIALTGIRL
jgi:putative DNA primase/helicase